LLWEPQQVCLGFLPKQMQWLVINLMHARRYIYVTFGQWGGAGCVTYM
jgi:hypothetical protein